MPASFNGFGSRFYGKCQRHDDDSYLTTEWFVLCYIPIIPLRSVRVIRDSDGDGNFLGFHTFAYDVVAALPIYWPQVWRVYGFILFTLLWYFLWTYYSYEIDSYLIGKGVPAERGVLVNLISVFFFFATPWLGLWLARWRGAKADRKRFT